MASCAARSRQELDAFPPKKLNKLARRSRRPKWAWDLEEGPVQASPSLLTGPFPTHSLPLSTPCAPIHRAAAHLRAPGEAIPAASPLTNTSRPPESLNGKLHSFIQQIVPDGQDGCSALISALGNVHEKDSYKRWPHGTEFYRESSIRAMTLFGDKKERKD